MTEEIVHAEPGTHVVVYSYGVHYKWTRNMPQLVIDQLRAAHNVREDLVSIFHEHEEAKKAIWSSYPEVAAAEAAIAFTEQAREDALAEVAKQRILQETKRVTGPAAETLRAANASLKAAKDSRRNAINKVKDQADARLKDVLQRRYADEKALYRIHSSEGDLYWGSFNDVAKAHKTAAAKVGTARANKQAAQLRHHRFDGTGRLAVQLQRGAGQPARTPEMLADPSGKYRNVLVLPDWVDPVEWDQLSRAEQRQRGRVIAQMRMGNGEDATMVEVPILYDRMLPADAEITDARLVIRKIGSKNRATLNITAKLPAPAAATDGPTVAIHTGWRRDEGGIRVATWRSSEPLDIPENLRHVMRSHDGLTGTVVIPEQLGNTKARLHEEQSLREKSLNSIREQLVGWLSAHGPVPHPVYVDRETGEIEMVTSARVLKWKAAGRFAILAHHWRDNPPIGEDGCVGNDIASALESWRATDKVAWDREAFGSRKVTGHRNDLYNQVAAVLGYQASRVLIDDTSIADLAAQTSATEELPNKISKSMGRQHDIAAPGLLRERITTTSKREGVTVTVVPAKNLTREHTACGNLNEPPSSGHNIRCTCGRRYDTDANAVTLMLTREGLSPAA